MTKTCNYKDNEPKMANDAEKISGLLAVLNPIKLK